MVNQEMIDKLVQQVKELPPLPQIAHKTLALLRNPDSNMSEIAGYIAKDQVMTSTVLSWANSAYYSLPNPVTTVHQAIMYLGQVTVRSIVLTACISTYLNRPLPGYGLERGDLWKHSIGVATGARLIASKFGKGVAEEAYFAGLLCDIGKLAFEFALRELDLSAPVWSQKSFEQMETEIFGINHAALGSRIARNWMLPDSICHTIFHHHKPSGANKQELVITSAVHIADIASMMMGVGLGSDGLRYTADPVAFQVLNFQESDLPALLDKISTTIHEAAGEFGLDDI
jgi:HD-like signal output (HDOD) protein